LYDFLSLFSCERAKKILGHKKHPRIILQVLLLAEIEIASNQPSYNLLLTAEYIRVEFELDLLPF